MNLGDRMKHYEKTFENYLTPRTPVIIRVDGRAFHTFTRNCEKPFDKRLMESMVLAGMDLFSNIQGAKLGYVQSDEISIFLSDYDSFETQAWFGYSINKIVSISSSITTSSFNKRFSGENIATFDSRAFNIPKEDVINYFLWRAKDWKRNSIMMYARSFFSHKELTNKNTLNVMDMLENIGKSWNKDLTPMEKNGTFIFRGDESRFVISLSGAYPSYDSLDSMFGYLV